MKFEITPKNHRGGLVNSSPIDRAKVNVKDAPCTYQITINNANDPVAYCEKVVNKSIHFVNF